MMAEKILTISIAAYNVESYIRQTLDSLNVPSILDKLEVFIIDDGGEDSTLEIAKEYEAKYPDTFHAVHKENGGYGSTVNWSLAHATGKYFKLLDGDDVYEKNNLVDYLMILESIDTDIVITPYFQFSENIKEEKRRVITDQVLHTDLRICDMKADRVFGMWAITYKTMLLKESALTLPSHCLYTDQVYSTVPFAYAETIRFEDITLYSYRVGRNGQSVSKESRIRHAEDFISVSILLCKFYEQQRVKLGLNLHYLKRRVRIYVVQTYKTFLLRPMSSETLEEMMNYDKKLKKTSIDLYKSIVDFSSHVKLSAYLLIMRACRFGRLGLLLSRIVIPQNGIDSWA